MRKIEYVVSDASEWEVTASETEQRTVFLLRKKNVDFYDVPVAEYLALEDAVKEEFGLDAMHMFIPERLFAAEAEKSYIEDAGNVIPTNNISGDVDQDGKVSVLDAQAALIAASDLMSELESKIGVEKIALADVDKDGYLTVLDAHYILRYYNDQSSGLEVSWEKLTGVSE